ncbi:hypothetical protein M569_00012 [Genlisea aurea]|uniref:Uncharacterized protein n=1 Tax=Genlisea aurea TaxID=192259 RepID=S8EPA2_9LAMI|nr:hypothetical protein M569_00012 [Genlisea aurea]
MRIALGAKVKLLFVDERILEPAAGSTKFGPREINSLRQGDLTLMNYYVKLKRLWDELSCIVTVPYCECDAKKICTCQVAKKALEIENGNRLIQFLMGLSDVYDAVRKKVLVIDPLPTVMEEKLSLIETPLDFDEDEGTRRKDHWMEKKLDSISKAIRGEVAQYMKHKGGEDEQVNAVFANCVADMHTFRRPLSVHLPDKSVLMAKSYGQWFGAQY